MADPSYYIIVERKENWLVDESSHFSFYGLTGRYKNAGEKVRKGDFLISYISGGVSAFSDIRECVEDGVKPLRYGGDYDVGFPIKLTTRPVVVLPPAKWVKVHGIVDQLAFLSGKNDWRQAFRHTFRSITASDALIIETEIRRAAIASDAA